MPDPAVGADEPLRTAEQWEWIRARYKPDGLRRLARANRHYADEHGYYLPDVAALAFAEWERAEALVADRDALQERADRLEAEAASDFIFTADGPFDRERIDALRAIVERQREALEAAAAEPCTFGPDEDAICATADPDGWTTWCAPCFARQTLAAGDS